MTKPTVIYDSTIHSSPSPWVRLPVGIRYLEVIGAMSTDSIQIQATLEDTGTDPKDMTELVFSEATKKIEVIRGGINIRIVRTGSAGGDLKVISEIASE